MPALSGISGGMYMEQVSAQEIGTHARLDIGLVACVGQHGAERVVQSVQSSAWALSLLFVIQGRVQSHCARLHVLPAVQPGLSRPRAELI
jgi:hypothetical protein